MAFVCWDRNIRTTRSVCAVMRSVMTPVEDMRALLIVLLGLAAICWLAYESKVNQKVQAEKCLSQCMLIPPKQPLVRLDCHKRCLENLDKRQWLSDTEVF